MPCQGGFRWSLPVDAHHPIRNTALGRVEILFLRQQPANMETYRDVDIGAGELMAKVSKDGALPKSMAATRLPCRFAGYNQVESLAMSLRFMHKLPS
jgi:hypothetical protein